jgi:hypothetical protein
MKTTALRQKSRFFYYVLLILMSGLLINCMTQPVKYRKTELFGRDWHFFLGDIPGGQEPGLDDFPARERQRAAGFY